jgi:surface antigen
MKKGIIFALMLTMMAGFGAPARASDKEGFGLILGALGGGVAGHQFGQGKGNTWATAIGAVTGAVLGQSVGRSLDRADNAYYSPSLYQPQRGWDQTTYYRAEPVPMYYVSPSYERRVRTYEVRQARHPSYIAPTYVVDNSINTVQGGRYCREYQQAVTVGGQKRGSYGTACMQPDGDWEIVQ